MKIVSYHKYICLRTPAVATIGMFDGVHRGHRFVIAHVCAEARRRGMASMVITFDRHPRQVVQEGWQPQLLTTTDERLALLAETGADCCVLLPFSRQMASLSAREFMLLMSRQLGVRLLLTGYDNRFGHDRRETFDDYVRYGEEMGMEVRCLPPTNQKEEGREVSSSLVRQLLADGAVRQAATCLTYPYRLTGTVVRGEHVGTRLGYPTANLQVQDGSKVIPAAGVYAVSCQLSHAYRGMMNIGTRPTFGEHGQTLEVHILGYEGDLYGQQITVSFLERLRDERRFDSTEALKAQLEEDKRRIESIDEGNR